MDICAFVSTLISYHDIRNQSSHCWIKIFCPKISNFLKIFRCLSENFSELRFFLIVLSPSVEVSKCNPVFFFVEKQGDGCEDVARETKMSKGNFGWETDYRIPSQTRAQVIEIDLTL